MASSCASAVRRAGDIRSRHATISSITPRIGPRKAKQLIQADIVDGTFRPPDAKDKAKDPVWFARYRYRGEATPSGNDLFYIGISAADGIPFTAEHPSKLRAGAARVKRFFGLDE